MFGKIQSVLRECVSSDTNLTQEDAAGMFPPAMENMKRIPIPCSYAFQDDEAEKELKSLKKKKEHEYRKNSSRLNSILTDLTSGRDLSDDDSNDDDDESYCTDDGDDGDSFCSSDEESLSGEWDEEDLLNLSNDNMITDDDINDIIEIDGNDVDT